MPPALADALQRFGYDALAASGIPALESLGDADLLAEVVQQNRVLVTFNLVDFVALTREMARAGRAHPGVILIHSRPFKRSDVGGIARNLHALLRSGSDFRNIVLQLSRRR